MSREQTKEIISTYIKSDYGEAILANIRKLEKPMFNYSSYTNHSRFSLFCQRSDILPEDLQPKCSIKFERSKAILQCAGKLKSEYILITLHMKKMIRLKNSTKQVKGKIRESITPEEFHIVGKVH